MSKKTAGVEFDQDSTDKATIDQPAQPDVSPVKVADKYVFGQYQDGFEHKGKLSIKELFAPGFDPTPYEFAWIRYNRFDDAENNRYFTRVSKMLHGKWFRPDAFHKMTGGIDRGHDAPGLDGKTAEVSLFVRTKEAAQAEQQQMMALSAKSRNPNQNAAYMAEMQGIEKAIGTGFMRGGLTQGVGGWNK